VYVPDVRANKDLCLLHVGLVVGAVVRARGFLLRFALRTVRGFSATRQRAPLLIMYVGKYAGGALQTSDNL